MSTLEVRNLTLGAGRPKIAVPITATTMATVTALGHQAAQLAVDLVEWRVDFWPRLKAPASLLPVARQLRGAIGNRPLLITLRTRREGGNVQLSDDDYWRIYRFIIVHRLADLVDLEIIAHQRTVIAKLVATAHQQGVRVVMSSHDFTQTPPRQVLMARLQKMEAADGDIAKFAVMPHSAMDVLNVLEVTNTYHHQGKLPLISMAMGDLGKVTRVSGELFGSCLTFASLQEASAPGQLAVADLSQILTALQIKNDAGK